MAKSKKIDWEQIERDYRADVLSIAQIARESGAPSSTIRARAKRNGWVRDLSTRIKMRADEFVNQDAIKDAIVGIKTSEEMTVDENARLTAGVRLAHRKDISRARLATQELFTELEGTIGEANRERLDKLLSKIIDVEDGIDADDWRAIAAYKRAISLSSSIGNLQKLADTMTKLVALERQAWNLDSLDDKTHDPLTELLHTIANNNNNAFMVVSDDPEYQEPATANTIGVSDDD
ncbi:terminase small subunit [Pseudoalteromonas phage vB_PalP_Y7]|nr:terminase small subunit [Pseudoalteromonas phage vB_PalP_Y7]